MIEWVAEKARVRQSCDGEKSGPLSTSTHTWEQPHLVDL